MYERNLLPRRTIVALAAGTVSRAPAERKRGHDMSCPYRTKYGKSPERRLLFDLVAGHHAGLHVFVEVAVEHPDAGIVGDHVHGFHLRGRDENYVGAFAILQDHVAVPMRSVQVQSFA